MIDDPIERRFWEIVKAALFDIDRGVAQSIASTNNPSVVAPPIDSFLNYLFLPGRDGGQTAHGGTRTDDSLVLRPNTTTVGADTGKVIVEANGNISSGVAFVVRSRGGTDAFTVDRVTGAIDLIDPTVYGAGGGSTVLMDIHLSNPPGGAFGSEIFRVRSSGTTVISAYAPRRMVVLSDIAVIRQLLVGDSLPHVLFTSSTNAANQDLFRLKGAASQVSDLMRWTNSADVLLGWIGPSGFLGTPKLQLYDRLGGGGIMGHLPASGSASYEVTWPGAQGAANTVPVNNGSGVLSWSLMSALTAAEFLDSAFRIIGSGDATKKLAFEVDAFTTATTRTLTPQNASYTIAGTDIAQTLSALQTFTVAPKIDIASAATGFVWTATDNDGNGVWTAATAAEVADNLFRVIGSGDATKKLAFEVDGFTTATTRTWTIGNYSLTFPSAYGALGTTLIAGSSNTLGWDFPIPAVHGLLSSAVHDTTNRVPVLGDLIFGTSGSAWTHLAGNTTATKMFLRSTGVASLATAPAWDTLVASDIPLIPLATGVSGDLPFANLTQGSARSVLGVAGNATADVASIVGVTPHDVLKVNAAGTGLEFSALAVTEPNIVDGSLLARVAAVETITGIWIFQDGFQVGNASGSPTVRFTDGATSAYVQHDGTLTTDHTVTFPDLDGIFCLTSGAQSLSSKTLSTTANTLRANTASNGVAFVDNTSTTKVLRMILSTASTNNHTITFRGTNARDYEAPDAAGNIVMVGNLATASATDNLASANHTGLGAAQAITDFTHTTAAVGMYHVVYQLVCTTADAAETDTIAFQIGYTDDSGARTQVSLPLAMTTAGTTAQGDFSFYVASGKVTYQTNLTGAGLGTARYALRARIIYLG